MEVYTPTTIRVGRLDEPIRLHATGDWHLGERGCAAQRLRTAIEAAAAEDDSVALLLGDLASLVAYDDRRWDPSQMPEGIPASALADWGETCVELVAAMAAPLRGRIVGLLSGNHEDVYRRRYHYDAARHMAERLGCRYLGYDALLTLCVRDRRGREAQIRLRATHGAGYAMTPGGKINRLRRYMEAVDADLVLVGHMHEMLSTTKVHLVQDGDRIRQREQLGVVCGTYLRTYAQGPPGYGERRGYPPVSLGHAAIDIIPTTGQMSVRWIR